MNKIFFVTTNKNQRSLFGKKKKKKKKKKKIKKIKK